ncbi:MAG: CDP-alcohol phosphatidyltransferase family protein [Thermoplasmatota archaeon]
MVLDKQRHRLDWWLVPLAKALRNVNPNAFTWLSLVAALVGAWAFYTATPLDASLLWLGWGMVLANSVLDLLDGKVARLTGKMSPKGDYLDHAIDRFSDALFLGGIALGGWVDVRIGFAAVVFTLLTSYLGTQAQAVGIGRNYGGLLGRADRMVLLLVIPVIQVATDASFAIAGFDNNLLGWMMVYIAAMGLITTAQRFIGGLGAFGKDGHLKE